MDYEISKAENLWLLDFTGGGRRGPFRMAFPGGYGSLFRNRNAAAPLSSRDPLSHCVGHIESADGHQRRPDLSITAFTIPKPGTESVDHTAGGEFLLESDFLQPAQLRIRIGVAGPFVGADRVDDLRVPQDRQAGGMAADPVSAVGDLCRLAQLERVGAELGYMKKYRTVDRNGERVE